MGIDGQRAWKANPYNVARGFAEGQLFVGASVLAVEAGSNQFVGAGFKFVVDRQQLLTLASDAGGHLLVSLDAYSEDNSLLLALRDNEWVSGDPLPWDIEFGYRWIRLRHRPRHVALYLDAREVPLRLEGDLWFNGQHFAFRPDRLEFNGVVKGGEFVDVCFVGSAMNVDSASGTFRQVPETGFDHAFIVSWPDPHERLQRGLAAYQNLLRCRVSGRNDPCPCGSGMKWKKCHGRGP